MSFVLTPHVITHMYSMEVGSVVYTVIVSWGKQPNYCRGLRHLQTIFTINILGEGVEHVMGTVDLRMGLVAWRE